MVAVTVLALGVAAAVAQGVHLGASGAVAAAEGAGFSFPTANIVRAFR